MLKSQDFWLTKISPLVQILIIMAKQITFTHGQRLALHKQHKSKSYLTEL
jgi:hypothetical protein